MIGLLRLQYNKKPAVRGGAESYMTGAGAPARDVNASNRDKCGARPAHAEEGRSVASSSAAPNGNLQFDGCLGSRRCRCFTPASSETARHSPRGDVRLRGVASHSFDLASSISGVTLSGSIRTIT